MSTRAIEIDRDSGEIDAFAGEVALDIGDDRAQPERRFVRAGTLRFADEPPLRRRAILFRPLQRRQPARAPRDAARTDRRVEQAVVDHIRLRHGDNMCL